MALTAFLFLSVLQGTMLQYCMLLACFFLSGESKKHTEVVCKKCKSIHFSVLSFLPSNHDVLIFRGAVDSSYSGQFMCPLVSLGPMSTKGSWILPHLPLLCDSLFVDVLITSVCIILSD